jgi:Uma2 family endonuclease
MTIAPAPPSTNYWTYERYMETPIEGRFEIVEGVLHQMAAPTWDHQDIALNIATIFREYAAQSRRGRALIAPFDLLIRRLPRLRTRQPDVFFISHEQLAAAGGPPRRGPLEIGPELVVEIISNSETARDVEAKTQDYLSIGVREMWRVYQETQMVDVVELTTDGAVILQSYGADEIVASRVFTDLMVAVNAIFAAPTL